MIWVGIDDTDTLESRGTNQLARELVRRVAPRFRCLRILRHQLLDDPRVPYTSKNGSASLIFESDGTVDVESFADELEDAMREAFIPGSDPGLCATEHVAPSIIAFGLQCRRELVSKSDAYAIADRERVVLRGLGGTEDGVIGALAAVGLAATGNDGRVVQFGEWSDGVWGEQSIAELACRGVATREWETGRWIDSGMVDVGKKLRPNWRDDACVLFVRSRREDDGSDAPYIAMKVL